MSKSYRDNRVQKYRTRKQERKLKTRSKYHAEDRDWVVLEWRADRRASGRYFAF